MTFSKEKLVGVLARLQVIFPSHHLLVPSHRLTLALENRQIYYWWVSPELTIKSFGQLLNASMEPPITCHLVRTHGPDPQLGSALEPSPEKALSSYPIMKKKWYQKWSFLQFVFQSPLNCLVKCIWILISSVFCKKIKPAWPSHHGIFSTTAFRWPGHP